MDANLIYEGKIIKIEDTQQVTDRFKKRAFVVETDENYSQLIQAELTQEKCSLIDDYKVGDEVRVHFNIRGREWNGRYFTNLNAWRLERLGAPAANNAPVGDLPPPPEEDTVGDDYEDDLPF
ncbi:DUF3127 domain-containing protein [Saprospira sp. CCB-QB6]|uniref:DUF3127 domain-containing protein n=1 Tax=Saprospira sp. CCB-QB6 TaxID=3023936 RepID=UPI0023496BFC|nr:DUF3127 domain-containing protein [Saprospira sp. CCB-QB6]WCL80258.1 DUF3127 domain-containing protein [Saprospira sp. CCB-QB6]